MTTPSNDENPRFVIHSYIIRSGETFLGLRYTMENAERSLEEFSKVGWKNLTIQPVERVPSGK